MLDGFFQYTHDIYVTIHASSLKKNVVGFINIYSKYIKLLTTLFNLYVIF
jgi:hypothetical protein